MAKTATSAQDNGVEMATIEDVAREAGVSISTVSYALSGKRPISEDTRARILDAAEKLGYAPRASARALAANRSDIIAVTAPRHKDTDPTAHMVFAMEVTVAARSRDFDTLLLVHDDALEGMKRSASTALADGIIVLDVGTHDDRAALARTLQCPVVFVGVPADHEGLTCVDLDFELAMRNAVDALVEHGHTAIALLAQPLSTWSRQSNYTNRVTSEFERHARSRGVDHVTHHPATEEGTESLDAILAAQPHTTAVILSTASHVASALAPAIQQRGLNVPQDLSVIAVGMTPMPARAALPYDAMPLDPTLTCPVAVDLLVGLIEGSQQLPAVTLVPPVYVSRGTVASAPVSFHPVA